MLLVDRSIIERGHIWYDLNIKNISEGKQHSWLSSDLCWEMCVKSPERCFIQKGQEVLWVLDKMQEVYFILFFVAHLLKKNKKVV